MDNKTKQEEEIEALSSIYGDEWTPECDTGKNFSLWVREGGWKAKLYFHLPPDYPSDSPPSFQVSAPDLYRAQKDDIHQALNDIYIENLGETVLFQWIEKVREYFQGLPEIEIKDESPKAEYFQPSPSKEKIIPGPEIVHGEVIEDRKSHFQGHVAILKKPEDVKVVLWNLKLERKIASATHNIMAWKCGVRHDCDDDGEKAAGGRLLKLMDLLHLENCIIIVSRWYGGVHLGTDRFRHINNAAKKALAQAGLIKTKHNASMFYFE